MDVGALFWLFWSFFGAREAWRGGGRGLEGEGRSLEGGVIRQQALGVLAGFFLFCMR